MQPNTHPHDSFHSEVSIFAFGDIFLGWKAFGK